MNAALVALLVLGCTFGGSLLGMWLRTVLPKHHVDESTRQVVTLAMGLIGTMAALVLGLVIGSAQSAFNQENVSIQQAAASAVTLDRMLARYGPETTEIRTSIAQSLAARLELTWPEEGTPVGLEAGPQATHLVEGVVDHIQALSPRTDAQRELQSRAVQLGSSLLEQRWLVLDRVAASVPAPFLVVVVCWLTFIFISLGLFAPRHVTLLVVLALCALSVAAAIFLILEMSAPYDGLIKVSSEPLRFALAHLGQ